MVDLAGAEAEEGWAGLPRGGLVGKVEGGPGGAGVAAGVEELPGAVQVDGGAGDGGGRRGKEWVCGGSARTELLPEPLPEPLPLVASLPER